MHREARSSPAQHGGTIIKVEQDTLLLLLVHISLLAALFREFTGTEMIFALGSYNISIVEPLLIAAILVIAGHVYLLKFYAGRPLYLAMVLLMLFALALGRGISTDPAAALFTGRTYVLLPLYIFIGAITLPNTRLLVRIGKLIIIYTALLVLLTYIRVTTGLLQSEVNIMDGRPMIANAAIQLVIATSILLAWLVSNPFKWKTMALLIFFIGALILSGQGTSMIAFLISSLFILLFSRQIMLPVALKLSIAVGGLVLIGGLIILFSNYLFDDNVIGWLNDRHGTNYTRQVIWESFLDKYAQRDFINQWAGLPMGTEELFKIPLWNNMIWPNSLHSAFFQTLSFFGAAGLIILLLVFLRLAVGLAHLMLVLPAQRGVIIIGFSILLTVILYGYSYDFRSDTGVWVLVIILVFNGLRRHAVNAKNAEAVGNLAYNNAGILRA